MTRRPLSDAVLVALALGLGAAPVQAQQAPRARADRSAPDRWAGPPVIGCPSLANYRMLMRDGAAAAAAHLADPKADHLGCAALARTELTGIVDKVTLGGQSYDCAGVRGTTACHWIAPGTIPEAPAPAKR
ncbi:MAG: hypothetical protein K2X54_28925 [Methylobacterium organophilum]|nr:hypothetical protein [Methylobacterium organophilum]